MSFIKVNTVEGQATVTINSREVAEMVNVRHTDLMRKINGYVKTLLNAKMRSVDFFIEDSYKDESGKENKCYELIRKGCDMVANKMIGEAFSELLILVHKKDWKSDSNLNIDILRKINLTYNSTHIYFY